MQKIIIASNNKNKVIEAKSILEGYEIITLKDVGFVHELVENEKSFKENAISKAKQVSKFSKIPCIADDSGLEIDALGGFPGTMTKRWMNGSDHDRNLKIIQMLDGLKKNDRKCKFICALAFCWNDITIFEIGKIDGYISTVPKGKNGFGFDEIFELKDGRTLAELSIDEKNQISARKIAFEKLSTKIKNII